MPHHICNYYSSAQLSHRIIIAKNRNAGTTNATLPAFESCLVHIRQAEMR